MSTTATCWEDAYRVQTERIAEIERENAKLRCDVYQCPPTSENSYEGLKWSDACAELERENAALNATLDTIISADERAVKPWRAAHPDKELVIPDRAKLVGWLLEENAALRVALVDFRDACFDALFLPAPNVKPYYALVKKHATFLPSPKPKKEAQP